MAINESKPLTIERLVRLLAMSVSRSLAFRVVFKVWKEPGLPDEFKDSLDCRLSIHNFSAHVENWRKNDCENESSKIDDELGIGFGFKNEFSREMRLSKDFRRRVKELYRLAYVGSYESFSGSEGKKLSWCGIKVLEKRVARIVHEFLSLTVAKMVEVEWISLFRKWFGIDLNIWDLFLDHLGIFYLSIKGNRHMIFLREAYVV
ncbi:hypothetical protein Syun_009072 [Stephania yunnanensis]|uniref:PORR domain-containing protein n=1 Tax=Stephania yunnanensis TaxID=152371 RepID=A0AAP0KDT6_9MAGN